MQDMNNQLGKNSPLDYLFKVERTNNLFDLRINGKRVWPRIRYQVSEHISSAKIDEEKNYLGSKRNLRIISDLILLPIMLFRSIIQILFLGRDISNIIFLQDDRFVNKDGNTVNQWLDPYIDHFINNDQFVLLANIPKERERLFNNSKIVNLRPFYIVIKLVSYFDKFRNYDHSGVKKIQNLFNKKFSTKISIMALISNHFFLDLRLEKFWVIILRKINPKNLIFVRGAPSPYLAKACNTNNVNLIEVQHCLISSMNINYYCHESLHPKIKFFLPNYIFTYGDFWKTQINLPIKSITAGYWYFHYLTKKSGRIKEKKKSIIVISAKGTRDYLFKAAKILAKKNKDYTIYYKLRPDEYSYWREIPVYADNDKPSNLIFLDDDSNIYNYFSEAGFTLSINSTMLYEASAMGSIGIVLEHGEYEELEYLYQNNFAELIKLKDLENLNLIHLKQRLTSIESTEFFSKPLIKEALEAISTYKGKEKTI
tara:strand:- start:272 stop:1720 length:1449 start_codon:yes stop_codon:yes gene_type:complete